MRNETNRFWLFLQGARKVLTKKELEEKYFGGIIEQWSEYKNLMKYLINHVVPWKEMFNSIDDVKIPNQPEQPYTSNPDTQ